MKKNNHLVCFLIAIVTIVPFLSGADSYLRSALIPKAKTNSARFRRFLKMHGREIAALVSGAAVGGLGVGFATHYYDSKKLKKNDDAHAVKLQEMSEMQQREQQRLTDDYTATISQITASHTQSLQEKDAALKAAADEYQRQLENKDRANAEEIERLRQTFETESREAHLAMATQVSELEQTLEQRNQEQAAQLERFNKQQRVLFDRYTNEQLSKIDGLKSDFSQFADEGRQRAEEMKEAFRASDERQKEMLAANLSQYLAKQDELLEQIEHNQQELKSEFKEHLDALNDNFNQAYGQISQSLQYLQQLGAMGIMQAQWQAGQLQAQLQSLNAQHREESSALQERYQAQQAQLVQMAAETHRQRGTLEELSEQGRQTRLGDAKKRVVADYDPRFIAHKEEVVSQLGAARGLNPSQLKANGLTGGLKKKDFTTVLANTWQLQQDGTYVKAARAPKPYSKAFLAEIAGVDRLARSEKPLLPESIRTNIAENKTRREFKKVLTEAKAAKTRSSLPTMQSGGHIEHTAGESTHRGAIPVS